jgi:hypothetical protein
MFASTIRKRRVQAMRQHTHWRWHLDEIYVRVQGEMRYLWRPTTRAKCLDLSRSGRPLERQVSGANPTAVLAHLCWKQTSDDLQIGIALALSALSDQTYQAAPLRSFRVIWSILKSPSRAFPRTLPIRVMPAGQNRVRRAKELGLDRLSWQHT